MSKHRYLPWNLTFWHLISISFLLKSYLISVLFSTSFFDTIFISFGLQFSSQHGSKSDPKSIKNRDNYPLLFPGGPRPSQGCPRDPQGLHLGAFWCPRAPPRVPKGPPRAPFWTILAILCRPRRHLGSLSVHFGYFLEPFWFMLDPVDPQKQQKS